MDTMNRPKIKIHNIELNEIYEREMNDTEFAQWQIDYDEAQAKATDKLIAEAKLAALGLTSDDLRDLGL